jgi:hypothetical protein
MAGVKEEFFALGGAHLWRSDVLLEPRFKNACVENLRNKIAGIDVPLFWLIHS